MLLTFYPDVSAAALARARAERPEYFAGGTIVGSHGDKCRLPDGRLVDCIFDVENATGNRHWQVIFVDETGGGGDDAFPLEAGPLVPIDESRWPAPTPAPGFAPIVAAALGDLAGGDPTLTSASGTLSEAASPAALEAAFAGTIAPAEAQLPGQLAALDATVPADVLATTQSHGPAIDANEAVFDEQPPGDLPPGPDLPPAPPIDVQPLPGTDTQ